MTIYIFTYWSTSIAKSDRPGEGAGDANLGDQHNGPGVGEWLHLYRDDPGGQAIPPMSRCVLGGGDPVPGSKLPGWRGCIFGVEEGGEGGMGSSCAKSCPDAN